MFKRSVDYLHDSIGLPYHVKRWLIRYDTIADSLTWNRQLSIQLINLTNVDLNY